MASDWGSAEPWMGALCNSPPRAAHNAVQEATQLSTAARESSSAADSGKVIGLLSLFSRNTIFCLEH